MLKTLLLLAALGQIAVPSAVEVGDPVAAVVEPTNPASQFLWDSDAQWLQGPSENVIHLWAPPGSYTVECIEAWIITTDGQVPQLKLLKHKATFLVEGEITPPNPPEPEPGPGPTPTPDAPPFPSEGLMVLILEESADRGSLPQPQYEILLGDKTRGWLSQNTMKVDGVPSYRMWDDDYSAESMAKVSEAWRGAYDAAKRESSGRLPWLIASDGVRGLSMPLPDNEDAFIEELERVFKRD